MQCHVTVAALCVGEIYTLWCYMVNAFQFLSLLNKKKKTYETPRFISVLTIFLIGITGYHLILIVGGS